MPPSTPTTYQQFRSQKTGDARDAQTATEQKLKAAQQDLVFWDVNNDPDALRTELADLQSAEQWSLALPPREDASRFRIELLTFAETQGLSLPAFDQVESVASLAEQEYQAIRFSIAAQGSAIALVGVLQLLQDFPTAAVQTLDFVRSPEVLDSWDMILELDVFFENGGA